MTPPDREKLQQELVTLLHNSFAARAAAHFTLGVLSVHAGQNVERNHRFSDQQIGKDHECEIYYNGRHDGWSEAQQLILAVRGMLQDAQGKVPIGSPMPPVDFSKLGPDVQAHFHSLLGELHNHAAVAAAMACDNARAATNAVDQYRHEGRQLAWEEAGRLYTTMKAMLGKEPT